MQQGTFAQEVIAGTVGGVSGICCVYPLDTVKVRLQTNAHYTGIRSVLKDMVSKEGVRTVALHKHHLICTQSIFAYVKTQDRTHTVLARLLVLKYSRL
jgi:solute carrier family 25, member 45/47